MDRLVDRRDRGAATTCRRWMTGPAVRRKRSVAVRITFVANDEVDTVGTITLGLDSNDGLLAERTHGDLCGGAAPRRRAQAPSP